MIGRGVQTARLATAALVLLILLAAYLGLGAQIPGTATTQAVRAGLLIALAVALPRLVDVTGARTIPALPWITGALGLIAWFAPWFLRVIGRDGLGYATYEAFRVPATAVPGFADITDNLMVPICARQGFDVYTPPFTCTGSIYGPGLVWLQVLPVSTAWIIPVGLAMGAASTVSLWWLSRRSSLPGQIVLLVASIGVAWLLLVERANLDAAIIWVAILLVFMTERWSGLWPWAVGALLIFILGTWKYYPFLMGLALLPVLRIRRGWMLLVAWIVAVIAFAAANLHLLTWSASANNSIAKLYPDGVLGRKALASLLQGSADMVTAVGVWDAVTLLLCLVAAAWGALSLRAFQGAGAYATSPRIGNPMLAIAGSTAFLMAATISGFGYVYKAALLLLCVPLLAQVSTSSSRRIRADGQTLLILLVLAVTIATEPLVLTLTTCVVGSYAFGLSAALLVRTVITDRPTRQMNPLHAGSSGNSP
ncbi:MAG: hypothetical protein KGN78_14025 [Actinomycetales bacterium]|nr:hypothetical protein [Actinomycetales bacterium]